MPNLKSNSHVRGKLFAHVNMEISTLYIHKFLMILQRWDMHISPYPCFHFPFSTSLPCKFISRALFLSLHKERKEICVLIKRRTFSAFRMDYGPICWPFIPQPEESEIFQTFTPPFVKEGKARPRTRNDGNRFSDHLIAFGVKRAAKKKSQAPY